MKQVKKLLVILPLVALFVLGSLPVFAAEPDNAKTLTIKYFKADGITAADESSRTYTIPKNSPTLDLDKWGATDDPEKSQNIIALAGKLEEFVTGNLQNGYKASKKDYLALAATLYSADAAELKLVQEIVPDNKVRVKAYDIFWGEYVPDVLDKIELREGWKSAFTITKAYYDNSNLPKKYLYAGFLTVGSEEDEVTINSMVFHFDKDKVKKTLSDKGAQYIALVVPSYIDVETWHIFPEGTRDKLVEEVPVPFPQWVALQSAWNFMDLNGIFKTRIQKINEEGYTFKGLTFKDGRKDIVGLLGAYDVFGKNRNSDQAGGVHAEIYYDKAVAAAQEVPTEKKVDAATAPQAQIQAPAAQAPVTAANTTTTTAPVNTLPVTGASDSIFLFLSSAALMAVGILFFKKH